MWAKRLVRAIGVGIVGGVGTELSELKWNLIGLSAHHARDVGAKGFILRIVAS